MTWEEESGEKNDKCLKIYFWETLCVLRWEKEGHQQEKNMSVGVKSGIS